MPLEGPRHPLYLFLKRSQQNVSHVFYVDGQTYCKRFIQYASNAVKLLSDNPDYKPIDITENSSFKIFGKVVAHTAPKQ